MILTTPQTTRWCVLTGPPQAGKSTLIAQLQLKGYEVREEVGRRFIEARLRAGETIGGLLSDQNRLQREIFAEMIELEDHLPTDQLIFLDRGLPDVIGFCRTANIGFANFLPQLQLRRYYRVFALEAVRQASDDPLGGYSPDILRSLATSIPRGYREAGYEPVTIPLLPIADRVQLVLDLL